MGNGVLVVGSGVGVHRNCTPDDRFQNAHARYRNHRPQRVEGGIGRTGRNDSLGPITHGHVDSMVLERNSRTTDWLQHSLRVLLSEPIVLANHTIRSLEIGWNVFERLATHHSSGVRGYRSLVWDHISATPDSDRLKAVHANGTCRTVHSGWHRLGTAR